MFDILDVDRATQAAAILIHVHGGSISPGRLLSLLYLADRASLRESGWPVVGHQIVASDTGPMHHAVADLISGRQTDATWNGCIQLDGPLLRLVQDPGRGQLSEHILCVLNAVCEQHRGESDAQLTELMKALPEWRNGYHPGGESVIPYREILDAVGFSPADVVDILEGIEEVRMMDALHEQFRHSTVQ